MHHSWVAAGVCCTDGDDRGREVLDAAAPRLRGALLGRIREVDHTAGELLEESKSVAPHMRRRSGAPRGIVNAAAVTISVEHGKLHVEVLLRFQMRCFAT